jgi:prepilin-type N-terminal cleavage/methylation domain-containing protein
MKKISKCFAPRCGINKRGFTLIETMIALFVFSVGVLAVGTMTVNALGGFTRARTTSVEVNRTTLNLETLKQVEYRNTNIFTGAQTSPMGSDGDTVGYNDTANAVVRETMLIVMQNNKIKGAGADNNYTVYFTKPLIE